MVETVISGFVAVWLCQGPAACDVGEYIQGPPLSAPLCNEMLYDPGHEHVNATPFCMSESELRAHGIFIEDWSDAAWSFYERYPDRIVRR